MENIYLTGKNTFEKVFYSESEIMHFEADNELLVLSIKKFQDSYLVKFEIL